MYSTLDPPSRDNLSQSRHRALCKITLVSVRHPNPKQPGRSGIPLGLHPSATFPGAATLPLLDIPTIRGQGTQRKSDSTPKKPLRSHMPAKENRKGQSAKTARRDADHYIHTRGARAVPTHQRRYGALFCTAAERIQRARICIWHVPDLPSAAQLLQPWDIPAAVLLGEA